MSSLRSRLLILLVTAWTTVWLAIALVTLNRSGHEIAELLDARLAQTAQVLQQLSTAGHMPDLAGLPQALSPLTHPYESKISFQLWRGGTLVSAFGAAPEHPLGEAPGFSDRDVGQTRWRVYGLPVGEGEGTLFVGESYAIRQELVHYLTVQALGPVLWSLPLTILLVWFAVSDGLRPLRRLAAQVGRRSSDRLTPIDEELVPIEVRPLTDAINRLMAELDEALAAERRFAADASHELRTPLAVIRTHAQIAQRSRDPGEREEALARLILGVDRATHLVSQLLVLARLDPDAADAAQHAACLPEVLAEVVEDKQGTARANQVELSLLPSDGEPCMISIAPSALEILIANLLDNAIKYSPPGGRVVASALCGEDGSVLRIVDSGRGIPAAEREQVSERFYRRNGQSQPGLGLGLSIVRRICERYGAELAFADRDDGPGLVVEVRFQAPGSSSSGAY